MEVLGKAFAVYVRPLLETFSQVWNPVKEKDSHDLERVQRRFTRQVFVQRGEKPPPYEERLARMSLQPLQIRRLHLDLCLAHSIFHSEADSYLTPILPKAVSDSRLRPSNRVIYDPSAPGQLKQLFRNRIARKWNELPYEISSLSFNAFKSHLKIDV